MLSKNLLKRPSITSVKDSKEESKNIPKEPEKKANEIIQNFENKKGVFRNIFSPTNEKSEEIGNSLSILGEEINVKSLVTSPVGTNRIVLPKLEPIEESPVNNLKSESLKNLKKSSLKKISVDPKKNDIKSIIIEEERKSLK